MTYWIKTHDGALIDLSKAFCIYIRPQDQQSIDEKFIFVVAEFLVPERQFSEKIEPVWKSLKKFETKKIAEAYIDSLLFELKNKDGNKKKS